MKGICLAYIGNDAQFGKLMSHSARALKISYKKIPAGQISQVSLIDQTVLLVVDGEATGAVAAADSGAYDSSSVLGLLAVGESGASRTAIPASMADGFASILVKTDRAELLKHQLGFYVRYLQQTSERADNAVANELIKKNRSLTDQVRHLQEQISRVDDDLHVQEEVLSKINQISQLSRQINCLDLDRIATVCIDQIPQLISGRLASLYAYDGDNEVLHLLRHNHPYAIARLVVLAEHANSPMVMAVKNKKLIVIKDFAQWSPGKESRVTRSFSRNYQSNSCIIAPLLSGDNILGVLNLADKVEGSHFDETRDLPPLELLCEIIGSAMSNIKLYEEVQKQAQADSMTGLANHRTFYNALDKELHRSQRYGGSLSLLMIDVDQLKMINDKQGHRAGDAVLMHVAEQIMHCIRDTDVPARYGGDEFAIILPNTSLSDAMIVAERLVKQVASEGVAVDSQQVSVSVSVGLGQYEQDNSIEEFMNRTDAALFAAKAAGKNRINIAEMATSA